MKIEEINIDGFGKFHKYHCQTSGKLEVFYGKNESGKTTLRKFMIAMLFGLEKSRGLAARYDDFTRYQPVNGGIYGGSMIFEKDGIRYKIMRNFGQGQTEYRIFDADTMEELKGKEYLFESDQQAFENTVSMTQAEIRTGREMKEVLQNSMANLRSSKDAAIDLRKAIDHLKARRRQMRKDPVFTQIDNLRRQQGSWQYDAQALNEYEQEEREIRKRLRQKRKLTLLQKILLWFRKLFGGEDEERIRKIELRHRLEKKELEIHEIELAMKAIEEAASQVQKTFGQELNEKISEIFCDMTNGKYTQAVMDENLSMMVYDGFDHVDMKYLSNATVEQLYFALRLASADLLYENDAFPLFLDDVFGNYDDERLAQTMQYLSHHTDRQIFLFTGRKEILRLLDEKEILYHLISL